MIFNKENINFCAGGMNSVKLAFYQKYIWSEISIAGSICYCHRLFHCVVLIFN